MVKKSSHATVPLNAAPFSIFHQKQLIANMVRAPVNFISGSLVHCSQVTIAIAGLAVGLACILVIFHLRPLVFTCI
jgi:hypothetical protein